MFCSMVLFYDATLLTIHLLSMRPPFWSRIVGKRVQNNATNEFVESFAQFSCLSQVSSRPDSHWKRCHSKVHTFFTFPRNSVVQGTSKFFSVQLVIWCPCNLQGEFVPVLACGTCTLCKQCGIHAANFDLRIFAYIFYRLSWIRAGQVQK